MKQLTIILILFGLMTSLTVLGQTEKGGCDTIYDNTETMPHYENGIKGLMDYLATDLTPILSECFKRDSILTASMDLTLTISEQGQVIAVDFQNIQATEACKEKLHQKIMDMNGWSPGQKDGAPVCSKYIWPVSCIKWD